jgi:hypothetical protein
MKRHLLLTHNLTDVEGNSYLWWCVCPQVHGPKGVLFNKTSAETEAATA